MDNDEMPNRPTSQQDSPEPEIRSAINFELEKPKRKKAKAVLAIIYILALILAFMTGALIVWYLMFDKVA